MVSSSKPAAPTLSSIDNESVLTNSLSTYVYINLITE